MNLVRFLFPTARRLADRASYSRSAAAASEPMPGRRITMWSAYRRHTWHAAVVGILSVHLMTPIAVADPVLVHPLGGSAVYTVSASPIGSGETRVDSVGVGESRGWMFAGTQGERIIVAAVRINGNLNPRIRLRRIGGMADEAQSNCGDRLDHGLTLTASYSIFVEDCTLTQTGAYNITFVKVLPDSTTSSGDPDGGPIASGQTLAGQMSVRSDFDGFQFSANTGERVVVTAVMTSGTLSPRIRLYPPDGGPEERQNNCGTRLDEQLNFTGVYTVFVEDCTLTQTGAYNITFVKFPGAASWQGDLDGGLINLATIPIPGMPAPSSGSIGSASDFDIFHFYGAAGDTVTLGGIRSGGTLDTRIRLYLPDGGGEAAQSHCGDTISDFVLPVSGLYSLIVEDCFLRNTGNYSVSIAKFPPVLGNGLYAPQPPVGGRVYSEGTWGSFRWEPVISGVDTVTYDLFFGTDVTQPLDIVLSGLTTNSVHVPVLSPGPVYYWHVVAYAGNDTIQGPYWWFVSSDATDLGDRSFPPEGAIAPPATMLTSHPNPFNPRTIVTYFVARDAKVELTVHDVRGRLIATIVDGRHAPGAYSVPWNAVDQQGAGVASGLYFLRYTAGSESRVHKLVLIR